MSQIYLAVEILLRLETTTYHLILVQMKKNPSFLLRTYIKCLQSALPEFEW